MSVKVGSTVSRRFKSRVPTMVIGAMVAMLLIAPAILIAVRVLEISATMSSVVIGLLAASALGSLVGNYWSLTTHMDGLRYISLPDGGERVVDIRDGRVSAIISSSSSREEAEERILAAL